MDNPYAAIRTAIAYVDIVIDCPETNGRIWTTLMDSKATPKQVVDLIKLLADDSITEGKIGLARQEMDRPEFLTYISGKMGYY